MSITTPLPASASPQSRHSWIGTGWVKPCGSRRRPGSHFWSSFTSRTVPGELAALGIIIRIVVADTKFAWIPVQALIRPAFAGILVAFPIYIFLVPALSSYAQLAVLLFAFVFVVDYKFTIRSRCSGAS
jgi:hypothetical protein